MLPPKPAKHRWSCEGQCPKVGGADGHDFFFFFLSVSCSRAFACSLVSPSSAGPVGAEGGVPELADLLTE